MSYDITGTVSESCDKETSVSISGEVSWSCIKKGNPISGQFSWSCVKKGESLNSEIEWDCDTRNTPFLEGEVDNPFVFELGSGVFSGEATENDFAYITGDAVTDVETDFNELVKVEDRFVKTEDDKKDIDVSVSITGTDSPVVNDTGTLSVNVSLSNKTTLTQTDYVRLFIDDFEFDSDLFVLIPEDSIEKTLKWNPQNRSEGFYTARVEVENDSDSRQVEVIKPIQP